MYLRELLVGLWHHTLLPSFTLHHSTLVIMFNELIMNFWSNILHKNLAALHVPSRNISNNGKLLSFVLSRSFWAAELASFYILPLSIGIITHYLSVQCTSVMLKLMLLSKCYMAFVSFYLTILYGETNKRTLTFSLGQVCVIVGFALDAFHICVKKPWLGCCPGCHCDPGCGCQRHKSS